MQPLHPQDVAGVGHYSSSEGTKQFGDGLQHLHKVNSQELLHRQSPQVNSSNHPGRLLFLLMLNPVARIPPDTSDRYLGLFHPMQQLTNLEPVMLKFSLKLLLNLILAIQILLPWDQSHAGHDLEYESHKPLLISY